MKIIAKDAYLAVCAKDGTLFTDPEKFSDPALYPVIVAKYVLKDDEGLENHHRAAIYHQDLDQVEITDTGIRNKPDLHNPGTATYEAVMGVINAFAAKLEHGPEKARLKPSWKINVAKDLIAVDTEELTKRISNHIKEEIDDAFINDRLTAAGRPEIKLKISSCTLGAPKSNIIR